MVRQKGAVSALLVTGSDKIESGFGNGDCLLLDFSRLIFAVSDGSERHPSASRILLERFAHALTSSSLSCGVDELQCAIGRIYKEQKYIHKCTFSCAALFKNKNDFTAFVSSGGDSAVIIADSSDGSVIFKTASDMNFAGRSNKAPGISSVALKVPGLRIILASDGFIEALNKIQKQEASKLPVWLLRGSVCSLAGEFRRGFAAKNLKSYDDIGMIIIDPFAVCRENAAIFIGGTLPAKEALFTTSFTARSGRWMEKEKWPRNESLLDSAGIKIKEIK